VWSGGTLSRGQGAICTLAVLILTHGATRRLFAWELAAELLEPGDTDPQQKLLRLRRHTGVSAPVSRSGGPSGSVTPLERVERPYGPLAACWAAPERR
jgi:hypothetical protein